MSCGQVSFLKFLPCSVIRFHPRQQLMNFLAQQGRFLHLPQLILIAAVRQQVVLDEEDRTLNLNRLKSLVN
jgi:hypothetical protein